MVFACVHGSVAVMLWNGMHQCAHQWEWGLVSPSVPVSQERAALFHSYSFWPATMTGGKSLPTMTSSFCEVPPINRVGTSPRVQEKTELVRGYRSLCLPFSLVHCSSSMFKHCTTFWLQLNLILARINVVLSVVVQTRLPCQSTTQANPQHSSILMGETFRGLNVASSVWGSPTWVRPIHKNSAVWLL